MTTSTGCSAKPVNAMDGAYSNDCASYTVTGTVVGVWTYYGLDNTLTLPATSTEAAAFQTDSEGFYINYLATTGTNFYYLNISECVKTTIVTSGTLDIC